MLLQIQNKEIDDKCIMTLKGVLDLSTVDIFVQNAQNIKKSMCIEIDFNDIKFIDSTGIGGLVQIIKEIKSGNKIVKVINISPEIFDVFQIIGLVDVFKDDVIFVQK